MILLAQHGMADMTLPIVFLPGMMCDARLFAPQIAVLSVGRSVTVAPITNHDTMQALADEVLAHAPPRFALAGLSMGGIVAMEVVRQAPDRVARLALLDTNPRAELPKVQAMREPQIAAAERGDMMQIMRDVMIPKYTADTPARPGINILAEEMAQALGPEVFVRQSRALRDRPDQCDTLRGYGGRALVLCGAEDQLCPLERHEAMHALLPNSSMTVVENAGHLPTLETPKAVNAALFAWLES